MALLQSLVYDRTEDKSFWNLHHPEWLDDETLPAQIEAELEALAAPELAPRDPKILLSKLTQCVELHMLLMKWIERQAQKD